MLVHVRYGARRSVFGQVGVLVPDIEGVELQALVDTAVGALRAMGATNIQDGDQLVVLQRRKASAATQVGARGTGPGGQRWGEERGTGVRAD